MQEYLTTCHFVDNAGTTTTTTTKATNTGALVIITAVVTTTRMSPLTLDDPRLQTRTH